MCALAPAVPKLTPLIRLLASDVDGEILAAARGLRRVLSAAGADLNDLADMIERSAEQDQAQPDSAEDWEALAREYLAVGASLLGPRDLEFLGNVIKAARDGRAPTPKQQKWLGDIRRKLEELA